MGNINMIFTHLIFLAFVFLFLSLSLCTHENDYCDRDEKTGACKRNIVGDEDEDDEEGPCWEPGSTSKEPVQKEKKGLKRMDGVKVGHEQEVDIAGKNYKLITRAMKPLLFEIPDFITDEEAEHIMLTANFTGMFTSKAKGGLTPMDTFTPSPTPGKSLGPSGEMDHWDYNRDEKIDMKEMLRFMRQYNYLAFKEEDIHEMIKSVGITSFDDGIITKEEFETLNTQGIDDYLNQVLREHPKFRQRYSEQQWLPMAYRYSTVIHNIRERVVNLTKLPRKIIYGGEHMQVVRYVPEGHYNAHYDSETHLRQDVPCCHHTNTKIVQQYGKCKLCRFITIMIYLNGVEEGGETAFPAADNATFDEMALRSRANYKDHYDLNHNCHESNLVIKPKKYTAIMWYNHEVDPASGWMGKMDEYSLHGGCGVRKGEKWIANIWLTAPYAHSVDEKSMYFFEDDFQEAQEKYNYDY